MFFFCALQQISIKLVLVYSFKNGFYVFLQMISSFIYISSSSNCYFAAFSVFLVLLDCLPRSNFTGIGISVLHSDQDKLLTNEWIYGCLPNIPFFFAKLTFRPDSVFITA